MPILFLTVKKSNMLHQNNNKEWFVLVTANRAEKKVGIGLSEIGIENFVPVKLKLRQWHDRKKWVEMPLFNNYIFVLVDQKRRTEVFKVSGIFKYLSIGGNLCKLTQNEIERVRLLCSYSGNVEITKGSLKKGEEIEIMEGHFIGHKGILVSELNSNKLKISIESLQLIAMVELEMSKIRKAVA